MTALLVLRCLPRTVRWQPLPTAALAAALLLGWADLTGRDGSVWLLRAVAVLLAAGAAYVLDDEAGALTAAVPVALGVRRGVRLLATAVAWGLAWGAALAYAQERLGPGGLPARDLTLEAAALLLLTLAAAAVAGGRAAAPAVAVLLLASVRLPQRWSLLAGVPGDASWASAHWRWLLLGALAALVLALASRDAAAPALLRRA